LAKDCPRIQTALGLHPQIAHERIGELALFEALLPEAKYVGEIGLDGSPEYEVHRKTQAFVLEKILSATARAGGRVMSIHCRRSVDQVLDALARYPSAGIPVLHWFAGTSTQLERAVSMGCWFSVGPAMIRGKRGSDLVMKMPPQRVLPETDGPFGRLHNRPLEPTDAQMVVKDLSILWKMDEAQIQNILLTNLRKLVSSSSGSMPI
jgi:TatD DNase family protein